MPEMTPAEIERARRALLEFYDLRRRDLPWRRGEHAGPYAVWISEVMLQQTRVEAVVPYYRGWMERFPDVRSLADAPIDSVLKAWEGLGYYARARNLHRAAALVRDRMGGELPRTAAALRELPGVGEYTAGAVASIAFGQPVAAVDGNVRRVLSRLYDEPDPTPAWLRARAAALVDPHRPGDFNQALMDLGATVCTPRSPRCAACPLAAECGARSAGTVNARPRPRARSAVPTLEFGVAVLVHAPRSGARRMLLVRRPGSGLLAGLWELPSREVGARGARWAARTAAKAAGLAAIGAPAHALPLVHHAFSHFRGIYRPFLWEVGAAAGGDADADVAWVDRAGLEARALPTAQRRIAERVADAHL